MSPAVFVCLLAHRLLQIAYLAFLASLQSLAASLSVSPPFSLDF